MRYVRHVWDQWVVYMVIIYICVFVHDVFSDSMGLFEPTGLSLEWFHFTQESSLGPLRVSLGYGFNQFGQRWARWSLTLILCRVCVCVGHRDEDGDDSFSHLNRRSDCGWSLRWSMVTV